MADTNVSTNQPDARIGGGGSNTVGLVVGVLAIGSLIGFLYYRSLGTGTGEAPSALAGFRAAMAAECKLEQFAKPVDAQLLALYDGSSRMQGVIAEQTGILKRGQPDCDRIVKVLKSVSYPVE